MVLLIAPLGGEAGHDGPWDSGSLLDALGSWPSTVRKRGDMTGEPAVLGMTVPPMRYTERLADVVSAMVGIDPASSELRRDLDRLPMKLLTLAPRPKGGVGPSSVGDEWPLERVLGR